VGVAAADGRDDRVLMLKVEFDDVVEYDRGRGMARLEPVNTL
jgi:hypothetical protein